MSSLPRANYRVGDRVIEISEVLEMEQWTELAVLKEVDSNGNFLLGPPVGPAPARRGRQVAAAAGLAATY